VELSHNTIKHNLRSFFLLCILQESAHHPSVSCFRWLLVAQNPCRETKKNPTWEKAAANAPEIVNSRMKVSEHYLSCSKSQLLLKFLQEDCWIWFFNSILVLFLCHILQAQGDQTWLIQYTYRMLTELLKWSVPNVSNFQLYVIAICYLKMLQKMTWRASVDILTALKTLSPFDFSKQSCESTLNEMMDNWTLFSSILPNLLELLTIQIPNLKTLAGFTKVTLPQLLSTITSKRCLLNFISSSANYLETSRKL